MNDVKVFKDPIHGTIKLHPLLVKIIDTPQFQRLRNIKQMGGKYFVYPGASHNRFEHSIGVSYLAGEFLKTLQSKQESLQISERDVLCVQIAGLCHDIGHGPFSHVFDSKVAPRLGVKDWKHEDASVLMFEYLLRQSEVVREECRRYELKVCEDDNTDLVFIKELILGCPVGMQHDEAADPTTYEFKGRTKEKWFLFEIVSNKFTSIDVDKWDNTARDCHGLGLSYDFDWKQYVSLCRVLEDGELGRKTICSRDKEVTSLYDMFHAREMLHRKALQLETSVGVELLLADALVESCTFLKNEIGIDVKEALLRASDPQRGDVDRAMWIYEQLNDTIIQTALLLEGRSGQQVTRISEIWSRLQHRQLYKMVGSMSEMKMGLKMAKKEKEELKDYIEKKGQDLEWPRDFEVFVAKFDYGMKDRDPLHLLKVHRNEKEEEEAQKLTEEEKSIMLPRMFEERHMRLYCKRTEHEKIEEMKMLFERWKNSTASPNSASPITPSSNSHNKFSFTLKVGGGGGGGGGGGERDRQTREVSEEDTSSSPHPSKLQLV